MKIVIVAAALAAAAQAAYAGTVKGTVSIAGPSASLPPLPVTKDGDTCGREVEDESIVVSGGRLANVVVILRGAPAPPPARAALGQQKCRFVPHVQVAPVGSTMEIVNGDPVLHNIHGWAGHATRFNVATPVKGVRVPTRLDRPGLIQVRCDVHGWMRAYVWVVDAPAAVTGHDGTFTISGVPAGTYTGTAWHERLGEKTFQVTVPAQGDAAVAIAYPAAPAAP